MQMPAHSSHLLQPLDVGYFAPLKKIYGSLVRQKVLAGTTHIDKVDFLSLFLQARPQAMTKANIKGAFAGAGLQPLDPSRVLRKLQIRLAGPVAGPVGSMAGGQGGIRTPSPHASPPPSKTPYNLAQLTAHTNHLYQQRPQKKHSPVSRAINQLIKGYEVALNSAVLLAEENRLLREEGQRRRQKKEARRQFIATGGSLTVEEGLALASQLGQPTDGQPTDSQPTDGQPTDGQPSGGQPTGGQSQSGQEEAGQATTATQKRRRAPPKCSICGSLAHNARICKNK